MPPVVRRLRESEATPRPAPVAGQNLRLATPEGSATRTTAQVRHVEGGFEDLDESPDARRLVSVVQPVKNFT